MREDIGEVIALSRKERNGYRALSGPTGDTGTFSNQIFRASVVQVCKTQVDQAISH